MVNNILKATFAITLLLVLTATASSYAAHDTPSCKVEAPFTCELIAEAATLKIKISYTDSNVQAPVHLTAIGEQCALQRYTLSAEKSTTIDTSCLSGPIELVLVYGDHNQRRSAQGKIA